MGSKSIQAEPALAIHLQLINIWDCLLRTRVADIDQNFFALGGRPVLVAEMLREVEHVTGKKIASATFLKNPTIRHLAQCLVEQVCSDAIFAQVQGGNGTPFYFFHGDILGGGFYARRLSTLLGHKQPFHVSPPVELNENDLPRVEELAARKRESLKRLQPRGPYLLGGFCVGAVIAYEVARQLEARGDEVRSVILIEPEIGNRVTRSHQKVVNSIAARKKQAREKVGTFMRGLQKIERLQHVWRAPLREKKEFILKNSRKVLHRSERPAAVIPGTQQHSSGEPMERDWLISAYHWVLTSYIPRRYRGRITLLLTDEHRQQAPFILKQWQKAAPQARVERIPGRHLSCITTHLAAIAEKIRAEMNAAKSFIGMLLPAVTSQLWG